MNPLIFFIALLFLHQSITTESRNTPEFTPERLKTPNANANIVEKRFKLDQTNITEIKRHLHRFGYVNESDDSGLESVLTRYQTKLGLPVTGKLDSATWSQILTPRCGFPDIGTTREVGIKSRFHAKRNYVYFPGRPRWDRDIPMTLTYAFSPDDQIDYLTPLDIKRAFANAFRKWSSVIPVSFHETQDYEFADIKIGFYGGDHGDGEPFDGVLGILAHSFSPESGKLHLDEAETWAVDFEKERSSVAVDLESVAVHEIGHVLGLGHSSVKDAVMYPSLKPRDKKAVLTVDDVNGVQALYGTNPNFTLTDLLASETSVTSKAAESIFVPRRFSIAFFILTFSLLRRVLW